MKELKVSDLKSIVITKHHNRIHFIDKNDKETYSNHTAEDIDLLIQLIVGQHNIIKEES